MPNSFNFKTIFFSHFQIVNSIASQSTLAMNQQFLPIFHPTPKFVPVVVRSNAPVGFTGSYNPSTCYHIPVFPGHASPDTKFTPTTSKTRRDLEQLGSPTVDKTLSEVIFELAAQKNGIRIGSVPNIGMKGIVISGVITLLCNLSFMGQRPSKN